MPPGEDLGAESSDSESLELFNFFSLSHILSLYFKPVSLTDSGAYVVDGRVSCINFEDVTLFEVKRMDAW